MSLKEREREREREREKAKQAFGDKQTDTQNGINNKKK